MPDPGARYVVSGLGRRAWTTYLPALVAGAGRLAGVVDADPGRAADLAAGWPCPVAAGTDLAAVLDLTAPDWLVVASPDRVHATQIATALAAGVSVLAEKPLVLGAAEAVAVLSAARTSAAELVVGHNLRYLNLHAELRDLVAGGRIGRVVQAGLTYRLCDGHGRSYFTRWHRHAAASGGLPVTKGCHHFDLLAWLLDDRPAEVVGAVTGRVHYPAPADADIDDTVTALVRFRGGATATYTLVGRSAWEGYELRLDGTAGGLAVRYEAAPPPARFPAGAHRVDVWPIDGPSEVVEVPVEPGRHGGADARMLAAFFADDRVRDPLHRAATGLDGAYAVVTGEAVTRAAATGAPVPVPDLAAAAGVAG